MDAVAAEVAHQRNRFGSEHRRVADHFDHLLHLGLEAGDAIGIDRARQRLHLVDRIVHRGDQGGDGAAVERRQEGAPDAGQHLADNFVRLVLAVVDFAQVSGIRRSPVDQLVKRFGPGDESRGMGFEHAEEVAGLWKQPLKPVEHLCPS